MTRFVLHTCAAISLVDAVGYPFLHLMSGDAKKGVVLRRLVDIGDLVKEGQLLAEIETPEVDAQLLQARAALGESQAALERN